MEFNLQLATEVLKRTPIVLNDLLRNLPGEWTRENEGPDTWSPFDILGHLIYGEETNWITRAQLILKEGEARPFEPFDSPAQFEESAGKSLEELLRKFESLRERNLTRLAEWNLNEDQLELTGMHPEFGVVTLRQLLSTWVVHDLSHLAQISRVMCKQYGTAVGPWKAYLPVLSK